MKIKLLALITVFSISMLTADEFVEESTTWGGYGELHWDMENEVIDFHRFVLFLGHTWNDKWSLKSEIELEHNMVGGSYGGYLELEQAYVNYNNKNWNAGIGVILAPVGIINITHEPPTFLSVERPDYHAYIIPTTWFDNGMFVNYSMGDFNFGLAMMADLDGNDALNNTPDKSGPGGKYAMKYLRGKGDRTTTTDLTKILTFAYTGVDGLKVGASKTMNDMPVFDTVLENEQLTSIGLDLTEMNVQYNKNNIMATFEMATGEFDYGQYNALNSTTWAKEFEGHYLDLGYNIGSLFDCNLAVWIRTSEWDANTTDNSTSSMGDVSQTMFGLTWWPTENVAFKIDSGSTDRDWVDSSLGAQSSSSDMMNVGLGYMF